MPRAELELFLYIVLTIGGAAALIWAGFGEPIAARWREYRIRRRLVRLTRVKVLRGMGR